VTSRLSLADDHLILDFPYDANQVTEIKNIQGAKWDKVSRVWRVPITSIQRARAFAAGHQFEIDPDVLLFDVPKPLSKTVGVSKDGEWLYLSFSYDPVKVKAVKSVPGITWDTKTKSWRAPLTSITQVIAWAEIFALDIPVEVINEAARVKTVREETILASKAKDAQLEIPTLTGTLLPYQKAGIKYATTARRSFIADDMGLGKTVQAIGAVEHANSYPAVVICPAGLVLNWRDEFNKWLPERRVSVVTNRSQFPEKDTFDVLVVGYPNISHWNKLLIGFKSYVFDESHYAKSPTAQRTKASIKMARSAPEDGLVLCLTGTPITNRPAEYASQLDILGQLNRFGGLWGFYRRYCGAFRDRYGQWHIEGASNLDELNETLRSICYIRRTKDQVLDELPPVRHSRLVVGGTPSGMKEYRDAEADIIAYIVGRAEEIARELGKSPRSAAVVARIKAESNEHLVRISVLRKLAAKAKMEAVYEWIDQKIGAGEKVVVAAHHREIVDVIANHYCGLKIQGGMSVEAVQEAKLKFQTGTIDEAPIIVLSIQAAKTGHTLTAAQEVLFVELPWSPADVDQTYSRCHRLGQKGSVMSTYILAAGTIDEEIYDLIASKRTVVNAATEGSFEGESSGGTEQLVLKFLESGLASSN
jgi:SNF2 family DNA or RNA helicase